MYRVSDAKTPFMAAEATAWLMCGGCLVDKSILVSYVCSATSLSSRMQLPQTHSMNPKSVCVCLPVQDILLLPLLHKPHPILKYRGICEALVSCSLPKPKLQACFGPCGVPALIHVLQCLAVNADWPAWKCHVQCFKHQYKLPLHPSEDGTAAASTTAAAAWGCRQPAASRTPPARAAHRRRCRAQQQLPQPPACKVEGRSRPCGRAFPAIQQSGSFACISKRCDLIAGPAACTLSCEYTAWPKTWLQSHPAGLRVGRASGRLPRRPAVC